MTHQFIARNPAGQDWVCGDVHGHLDILHYELDRAGFNPDCDRLFLLGDLIDRGPQSEQTLGWALTTRGVHSILGNHELLFVASAHREEYRVRHRAIGGQWADSLDVAAYQRLTTDCRKRFPLSMTLETNEGTLGLVHAQSPFDDWRQVQAAAYSERFAIDCTWPWSRATGPEQAIAGVTTVVSGHIGTPKIVIRGNQVWIDTFESTGDLILMPTSEILRLVNSLPQASMERHP